MQLHMLAQAWRSTSTRYVLGCEPSSGRMAVVVDFGRGGLARGSVLEQATPTVKPVIWVMNILICFNSLPSFHGFAMDGIGQSGSVHPNQTKKRISFALNSFANPVEPPAMLGSGLLMIWSSKTSPKAEPDPRRALQEIWCDKHRNRPASYSYCNEARQPIHNAS